MCVGWELDLDVVSAASLPNCAAALLFSPGPHHALLPDCRPLRPMRRETSQGFLFSVDTLDETAVCERRRRVRRITAKWREQSACRLAAAHVTLPFYLRRAD